MLSDGYSFQSGTLKGAGFSNLATSQKGIKIKWSNTWGRGGGGGGDAYFLCLAFRKGYLCFFLRTTSERVIFKTGSILVEANETRSHLDRLPILDKHDIQRNHGMSAINPNEISPGRRGWLPKKVLSASR